jgi:crotonobetainyl-CoA:carnitine CoA-transferase CaiB-like acyl-CoA transferase
MSGYETTYRTGPALGADQPVILAELGYDNDAVERLRAGGAFGPGPDPRSADGEAG